MDKRDRLLNKHMKRRMQMASALPVDIQRNWAMKCLHLAACQHRFLFYLKVCLWLASIDSLKQHADHQFDDIHGTGFRQNPS